MRRSLAVLAVLALSLVACGEAETDADGLAPVDGTVDPADDTPDTDEDDEVDDEAPPAGEGTVGGGGEPDPAAVADPCEPHQDREDEAFLDVVAPVQDQQVSDGITLVGCSNVHEATVQWRLLDGDGATLDEGFTTAECGSGCVGAFEEGIDLGPTAAEEPYLYLQVFWEDVADGSDRDLTEVGLVVR